MGGGKIRNEQTPADLWGIRFASTLEGMGDLGKKEVTPCALAAPTKPSTKGWLKVHKLPLLKSELVASAANAGCDPFARNRPWPGDGRPRTHIVL